MVTRSIRPADFLELPERAQLHLAGAGQRLNLIHCRLVGAEAVAAVNHHDRLRDPLQIHRPVECRVAAADDEDALAGEGARIQHAIMQTLLVPLIHVFERQLPRGERPDPAGDQHRPARILVFIGDDREQRLAVLLAAAQPDDFLGEVDRRLPLQALLGEGLHEVLGENLRKTGDVEDVFLRIERGQLATDLVEVVDQTV